MRPGPFQSCHHCNSSAGNQQNLSNKYTRLLLIEVMDHALLS